MKKPKYNRRHYQGRYESWLIKLYGSATWNREASFLERFFDHFDPEVDLALFTITDAFDYATAQRELGYAPRTVELQMLALERFWHYLIEQEGLTLFNPFGAFIKGRIPTKVKSLTLSGVRQLLSVIDDVRVREWILSVIVGHRIDVGLSFSTLRKRFDEAVAKTDLRDWLTYQRLITGRNKVRTEILRLHYKQLRNAFVDEAQLACYGLGHIQITTPDVWATVGDCDEYASMVTGI